jgi:hypothetical protein
MGVPSKPLCIGLVVALAVALAAPALAQEESIKNDIARLQLSLKERPFHLADFPDIGTNISDSLKAASDALQAGRLLISLEQLSEAYDLMQGARAAENAAEVEKGGLPAFEERWNQASLKLTTLDQQAHKHDWSHAPAVLEALAEAAQGKSLPLLEGGRGFATATAPKDGLFYVGEAQGEADFAQFCASLNLPRRAAAFPLRSMTPELQTLQEKTNAAFQPPKSIDLHSRFIGLNAAIKLARELDATKFYAGSLYQYLEAVRRYGMLDAPPLDAAKQSALKQSLATEQKKLAASDRDESIAQLFLERAVSYTAHPDGSASTADEWRSAQVIIDQVLPAYLAAAQPASPSPTPSGNPVTITLVRWPYT